MSQRALVVNDGTSSHMCVLMRDSLVTSFLQVLAEDTKQLGPKNVFSLPSVIAHKGPERGIKLKMGLLIWGDVLPKMDLICQ